MLTSLPAQTSAEEAPDTCEEAIKHEVGYYYTIQRGDTLWDLSEQFFDSPWYWPDLWHENNQIPNPHWIYPGQSLRLFRGESIKRFDKPLKAGIAPTEKKAPGYYYSLIDKIGFVKKEPVPPLGRIFKVLEPKEMISQGDTVYIQPSPDVSLCQGARYTIYRTVKTIIDKTDKSMIGIQHYLTGIVEITRLEPRFAIATIIKSYRSIQLGDLLMPYIPRSPEIILTNSPADIRGNIIGFDENNSLSGDNMIAFIDKGENDGIKPGQTYSIYEQDTFRFDSKSKDDDLQLIPVDFGKVLVLLTQPTTSTVLITYAKKSVVDGAAVRSACLE